VLPLDSDEAGEKSLLNRSWARLSGREREVMRHERVKTKRVNRPILQVSFRVICIAFLLGRIFPFCDKIP
jgi:hypothetical protein